MMATVVLHGHSENPTIEIDDNDDEDKLIIKLCCKREMAIKIPHTYLSIL